MRRTILTTLILGLLLVPTKESFGQARMVMSGEPSILGVCNDELILTGRLGPVSNGLLRYDGRRVTVAANFSRSGQRPSDPWATTPRIPSLPGVAPLLFLLGGGKEALATTCGTPASTKTVINPFDSGGLHSNFITSDGKLIVSRINQRSIDLFSVEGGKATLLGSVPTMSQNPRRRPMGGEVYTTSNGFVLRAPHPTTKQPLLWTLTSGGFQLLSAFPDLVAEGYTFIRVLKFDTYQISTGSLAIKVSARSAGGQDQTFLYVSDGSSVQRLAGVFNYVLPVQDLSGFLSLAYDPSGGPDTRLCSIGLFRAPNFEFEDITPQDGLVSGDEGWCLRVFPRVTSGSSLFFTHNATPNTLRRFNANTGAVTTVIAADTSFDRSFYFLNNRLFLNLVRSVGEYGKTELYVSDGTEAGTVPIRAGNRTLLGVEPRRSIVYENEMYTNAYTRLDARTGAAQGSGLYRILLPVGPVSE